MKNPPPCTGHYNPKFDQIDPYIHHSAIFYEKQKHIGRKVPHPEKVLDLKPALMTRSVLI